MKTIETLIRACRPALAVLALPALTTPVLAETATATASLTNIQIQVIDLTPDDGIWPWVTVFTQVDWLPLSSSVLAEAGLPVVSQSWSGWLGSAQSVQATPAGAMAVASLGAGDLGSSASGAAAASADDGLTALALAQIFSGRFLAGAGTRVVVTATVENLSARGAGGDAQAVVSLGIADESGSAFDESQAWVFDTPGFVDSFTPGSLSVQWDNTSADAKWGQLLITASAQVSAVPEPGPAAMLTLGLLALAWRSRAARRGQA